MTNKDYKPLTTGGYTKDEVQHKYIDRLCYLENCIKNGTLIFVPCKMTNREWLQTLTDEEFVRIMCSSCESCTGHTDLEKCNKMLCRDGRIEWLKQEHKENNND